MTDNKLLQSNPKRARITKRITKILATVFRLAFLICISYIVVYPLLYMLVSSISTESAFLNSRRIWIPAAVTTKFYGMVSGFMEYFRALGSTLKNEIVAGLLEVCSCAVAAYGFSRFNFKGKRLLIGALFLTILIPTAMLVIPLSVNYSHLDVLGILGLFNKLTGIDLRVNILNTSWAFWLPSLFGSGLRSGILIYIYMQFFKGLPSEFEEAAYVDGAGPVRTFLQIIIPSSSVVILTVTVFSFIWHWNDYQLASLFTTTNMPLSVSLLGLPELLQVHGYWMTGGDPAAIALIMAACIMFILPPLVLYLIIQHWFIESVDRVGITG